MMELKYILTLVLPALFHIAYILGVLLALLLVSRVLRSPRIPAATIGWLLVIVFVPLIGIPLYLFFGERKVNAQLRRKAKINLPDTFGTHHHPVHALLVTLGIPSSTDRNLVHFHEDEKVARQELFALLDGAQRTIDIAIFILGNDRAGKEVLSHLEKKAKQGVQVRLLLDGVGSFKLPKTLLHPLAEHGGKIAWFIPVLHQPLHGKTNLRNHRKIVITDNEKVWTGGRNLATKYLEADTPKERWIDLSFSLQGTAVSSYRAIFEADWCFATNAPSAGIPDFPATVPGGESRVQVIPSGPDVADDPIYAAILTACYVARRHIMITTPYYVPDSGVQEALRLAALRGIEVDLILPAASNHRLADIARNRYLRELAKAGARIWLLPDIMIHAKALVFDKTFSMAGTANLDIRSLFLNYEVMSSFYSEKDIEWLTRWMVSLRNRSERYHPRAVGLMREMLEGLILLGAYEL